MGHNPELLIQRPGAWGGAKIKGILFQPFLHLQKTEYLAQRLAKKRFGSLLKMKASYVFWKETELRRSQRGEGGIASPAEAYVPFVTSQNSWKSGANKGRKGWTGDINSGDEWSGCCKVWGLLKEVQSVGEANKFSSETVIKRELRAT